MQSENLPCQKLYNVYLFSLLMQVLQYYNIDYILNNRVI